jgi:pimeloyl-ACP methyl ester carboxylesterase
VQVSRHLERNMERVFAILPRNRVGPAVAATLARLRETGDGDGPDLKWAEFDLRGRFRRGGVVALFAHVARVVATPSDDPDLAAMARGAADGEAQAGRIVREPGGNRFVLYLPASSTAVGRPPQHCVRGYLIDEAVFGALHVFFNPGSGVTEAERRAMFQLVAGTSLREAAALDGVSVETKRVQVKSAAAKLQCAGQLDLVRLMIGQLTYVSAVAEDEAGEARFAGDFVARNLAGGVELTLERLTDGRLRRCLEVGPADGRPVVTLHGMMFGTLISGARPALEAAGLRLIVPLRRGYLDPRPVLGLAAEGTLADLSLVDVADLIERRSLGPATVLGHSLGAVLALRLADRRPELVARLVIASINNLRSGPGDAAGRLYDGYRQLAGLSRAITHEFSRHYGSKDAAQQILHGMFAGSPADVDVLEGRHAARPVYDWFPDLYAGSVAGIADDYVLAMDRSPPPACPTLFLHGADDTLTPVNAVRAMSGAAPLSELRVIAGGGHFALASHGAQIWPLVAEFAEGR